MMIKNLKSLACAVTLFLVSLSACASYPKCDGSENWASSMAFSHLKNEGVLDNYSIDFSKTKVVHIASQNIDNGIFMQVHKVEFHKKDGTVITVLTENKASNVECSEGPVTVYLVKKILGSGRA